MKSFGLGLVRTVGTALIAVLPLGSMAGSAEEAISSRGVLTVTATILKHASLQVLAHPKALVVTAADIARGYVDVSAPLQVTIRSNSRQGYMLVFANQSEVVRQTRISGLGDPVQLGMSGGVVVQPYSGHGVNESTKDLRFRFELDKNVQQGIHAWPLQLSVSPL